MSTFDAVTVTPVVERSPTMNGPQPTVTADHHAVLGHQNDASSVAKMKGFFAVPKNLDAQEQESECCFFCSKWMPGTCDIADVWCSKRSCWPIVCRNKVNRDDPIGNNLCVALFFLIFFVLDVVLLIVYKIPLSLYRCCTKVDPFNIPLKKRTIFNGYIYVTAHFHDVDGGMLIEDCDDSVSLDAGFEVAPGDDSDVAVSNAHAWGSRWLAFADSPCRSNTSLQNGMHPGDPFKGVFCEICATIKIVWTYHFVNRYESEALSGNNCAKWIAIAFVLPFHGYSFAKALYR
jgi:hypothetical protein